MSGDARVGAWITAWQTLEAARKMRLNTQSWADPLYRQMHRALITDASVYAELARADISVGLMAGDYLEQQEREQREHEADIRHTIDHFFNKTKNDDEKGDNT